MEITINITNSNICNLETNSSISDSGILSPKKLKGSILFKNVGFSYIQNQDVLRGFSINVKPGEKIAIVGPTGAGKTSVINLLSRLYEFQSGHIEIDNISIKDIKLVSLRRHICTVSQDVFLFAASVYDNITLFNLCLLKTIYIFPKG